jgi:hypothetical protein
MIYFLSLCLAMRHCFDIFVCDDKMQGNYTAPRMVLAASGVEHDELVSIVEPLLCDLPGVKHPKEPKSVYVGGDYRCQTDSLVSCWNCRICEPVWKNNFSHAKLSFL